MRWPSTPNTTVTRRARRSRLSSHDLPRASSASRRPDDRVPEGAPMPDAQQPIDDLVVEDALVALAGRECEYGGGPIDPETFECGDGSHVHGRWFCREAWCEHAFVSWD